MRGSRRINTGGLPHSDMHGSKRICRSPCLIAACHVLHRLLAPRHPSCALCSLINSSSSLRRRRRRCGKLVITETPARGLNREPRIQTRLSKKVVLTTLCVDVKEPASRSLRPTEPRSLVFIPSPRAKNRSTVLLHSKLPTQLPPTFHHAPPKLKNPTPQWWWA
jgi:hypothetical protein